ncbi:protein timeless homolog [Agrilus planipennis]|uniref:Protein timeless homolog n=1 Tax=Agrilus planipennis TaxID=224129 RepID=A0A1W4X4E3_AGRPL|nr:protein timeless homolog [Agrilus planipennis]
MSSLLQAELAATCNAIGYFDADSQKYYTDDNTLETVKDIIRYLRRDDDTHEIRRFFGDANILETDLLPLIKNHFDNTELFDVVLRLLVNLTTPALVLWNEEAPKEKTARNYYLQIEDHLQIYKQAFADEKIWAVLSKKLTSVLDIDIAERGDENSLIIERILILIRNVLYIPSDLDRIRRPDNDANVHDQVIWALHQSGMIDIMLYIVCSGTEKLYHMHVMEVLYFMLREQNPTELAQAALQRSQTEKTKDEAELLAIRHREVQQRQQKMKKFTSARHSRFGGTYVINSMKSISDENNLIYHKPLNRLDDLNFDAEKVKPKTPKNRLPVRDVIPEHRSAFSIRLLLKEFCVEFLNGAYNTVMHHIKSILSRSKNQQHDESYYMWALKFFMEFNRSYKFEIKFVSETVSIQTFHFIQQQIEKHFDMMVTDKAKLQLWSRRLHLALMAYKELLLTLMAMDRSPDGSIRDSSMVLKSNLFYVVEYRELILTLLISYDELKMSHGYLNDLIETQHIFLKMLQSFSSKQDNLIVQKKNNNKKKPAKKNKKKSAPLTGAAAPAAVRPEKNLESLWEEVSSQLSAVLENPSQIPSDIVPFDASSDTPIDEQKEDAMKKIQLELRKGNFEMAIALFRAAREVWPENDCFGEPHISPEEEFLALGDIFFAELGNPVDPNVEQQPVDENEEGNDEETEDEGDENEEEEEYRRSTEVAETDFNFSEFLKRLAHPKVVRSCALVLANFDKNSVTVNHCLVKLLHRIAWDCKMHAMIFQLSIFRTFQRIFAAKDMPQFSDLVRFAKFIMREFFKTAQKNKHIFMEVLFWKNSREAFDVEEGYGSYQQQSSAAQKMWTELEEEELRRLFMEHQEKRIDEDVVDWIQRNLINSTRSRRGILKKLKELYLLTEYRGPKKKPKTANKNPDASKEDEDPQLASTSHQEEDQEETSHVLSQSSSSSEGEDDDIDENVRNANKEGNESLVIEPRKKIKKLKTINKLGDDDDSKKKSAANNDKSKQNKKVKKPRMPKNESISSQAEIGEEIKPKKKMKKSTINNKSGPSTEIHKSNSNGDAESAPKGRKEVKKKKNKRRNFNPNLSAAAVENTPYIETEDITKAANENVSSNSANENQNDSDLPNNKSRRMHKRIRVEDSDSDGGNDSKRYKGENYSNISGNENSNESSTGQETNTNLLEENYNFESESFNFKKKKTRMLLVSDDEED